MNPELISTAKACLQATHDASLSFPQVVGKLIDAGFEGYMVDYRRNTSTYYLADGQNTALDIPAASGAVADTFDPAEIERLVRWAQANDPDYTYKAFCEKARAAGCAGYLVSFLGRRVVYFGRTAETHVEHFPQ